MIPEKCRLIWMPGLWIILPDPQQSRRLPEAYIFHLEFLKVPVIIAMFIAIFLELE